MMQHKCVWLPDNDAHMIEYMNKVPEVDGRGAYQHEKWTRVYHSLLRSRARNRTALDIGAHVGLWTMTLAKHFDAVVCFEPVPEHQECWIRNVPLMLKAPALDHEGWYRTFRDQEPPRHRVTLVPFALGNEQTDLRLGLEREGWSGCTRVVSAGIGPTAPLVREATVRQVRLDDLPIVDVDFIKLDVEGFELFVLKGGAQLLQREHPAILVEQKPDTAKKYGLPQIGAVEYLQSLGARLHWSMIGDYFLTWP